jgi:hypothetical protein
VTDLPVLPTIHKLTHAEVESRFEGLIDAVPRLRKRSRPIPNDVLGAYQLPRESLFVATNGYLAAAPFSFRIGADVAGGYAHMVLAETWGTIAHPVFLRQQRIAAEADVKRLSARIFADVNAWLPPGLTAVRRSYMKEGLA